jgi:hypothetical protein
LWEAGKTGKKLLWTRRQKQKTWDLTYGYEAKCYCGESVTACGREEVRMSFFEMSFGDALATH